MSGIRDEFVFIGPPAVGKTAISTRVAELAGIPRVEIDVVAMPYYEAAGWSGPEFGRLATEEGFLAA